MNNIELSNFIRFNYRLTSRSLKLKRVTFGEFVNDADYLVSPRIDGKQKRCPAYSSWMAMIIRCNHPSALKKRPEYINVSICREWNSFMSFRKWWVLNSVDGYHLDKDLIIPNNKEYSPSSCVFIPHWLNTFLCDQKSNRGEYAVGVSYRKSRGKFAAECRDPIRKKGCTIGYFDSEIEANHAYVERKLHHLNLLADEIDKIDARIFGVAMQIIESRRI